jgi:hypothetical protein
MFRRQNIFFPMIALFVAISCKKIFMRLYMIAKKP